MKWLKSRCRKNRCKYPLYFSGCEWNTVDRQPKTRKDNQTTEGEIAHHKYEEAGEKNIKHSIQNPRSKPQNQKVRKFKLWMWRKQITIPEPRDQITTPIVGKPKIPEAKYLKLIQIPNPISNRLKDSMEPTPKVQMPNSRVIRMANCHVPVFILIHTFSLVTVKFLKVASLQH